MIRVHTPQFSGNEKKYLAQCIDEGWISSEGPFVKRLEQAFAAHHHVAHGIAVTNGSAALDIALKALELKAGDEVILPTFTIISCLLAVLRCGATPVLVDSDPFTWNMSVEEVLSKITGKTRAIMLVHLYGLPVDMQRVVDRARATNIAIIEDCAQLMGQCYHSSPVGSFGTVATFSLYANKNVTSGEGGMIVCDNTVIAERCRSLRNLCFQASRRFVHEEIGWNARLSNLQAAVALAQYEKLGETLEAKRRVAALYNNLLADIPAIQLPLPRADYSENLYWIYGIVINDDVSFDAAEAIQRLSAHKIEARPFFWCMHEQPLARKLGLFHELSFPHAEKLARRGLYIPSGVGLLNDQIHEVSKALHAIF